MVIERECQKRKDKHMDKIRTKSGVAKEMKPWTEIYKGVPEGGSQRCPLCFKVFNRRRNLWHHLRRNHFAEKEYGCADCDKVFRNKQSLIKHLNDNKCRNDKMVKCNMCGLRCEDRKEWQAHYSKVHQNFYPRPLKCDACPKAISTTSGR